MRTWESELTHKIFNGPFELWEGMRSGLNCEKEWEVAGSKIK